MVQLDSQNLRVHCPMPAGAASSKARPAFAVGRIRHRCRNSCHLCLLGGETTTACMCRSASPAWLILVSHVWESAVPRWSMPCSSADGYPAVVVQYDQW